MESASGIEGSEEGNIQHNEACKPTADFASIKEGADPVVYKLVRVDYDGRFVPATDNELMEVEDFFDYENSQILSVADVVQTAGFGISEVDLPDKHLSGGDEAFSQYENSKGGEGQPNSDVKCAEDTVQEVAEEERHGPASGLRVHPSNDVDIVEPGIDHHGNLAVMDNKDPTVITFVETLSTSGSTLHDTGVNQSGSPRDLSDINNKVMESEIPATKSLTTLKPDFSFLRGEINLDNFTVMELQEIFRATFGRETSVKDKQWLKRRIAMGLVNSCDIPMTSYIIKDNKLVMKVKDENSDKVDDGLVGDIGLSADAVKDVQVFSEDKIEDDKRTRSASLLAENDDPDEYSPVDQRAAAKRVRKPTKRYIEEISDLDTLESVGWVIPSDKHSDVINDSSNSAIRSPLEFRSSDIFTRLNSLGGSGFQVPRVSRIRRCRPRKSIISLAPYRWDDGPIRDAAHVNDSQLALIGGQRASDAATVCCEELPNDEEQIEKLCSEIDTDKMAVEQPEQEEHKMAEEQPVQEHEPVSADASGNNANITTKGGMRRKHHRAWSLSEVVKLVDGVSRYGAGRWSEIKRVSFASSSYRTSVDLKDKWRNLLKASFAYTSSDKGMSHHQQQLQQRKPTTMPIPTPILLKVRELAEMHGQVPRNYKTSSRNGGGECR